MSAGRRAHGGSSGSGRDPAAGRAGAEAAEAEAAEETGPQSETALEGLDEDTELEERAAGEQRRARQAGEDGGGRERRTPRAAVRELYYGDGSVSQRFRYGLLAFDVVTVAFFVVTTVIHVDPAWHLIDLVIGVVLVADVGTRLWISMRPWHFVTRLSTIGDLVVIVAIFGSLFVSDLQFLRILRMLRILRSYHLARELKREFRWYRRNEEIVQSATNLFVFIFVTTSLVYVVEEGTNPGIDNYLDALYFTMATLTTTGFGDIVVTDDWGRILAVVIMVLGVALFLRLIQTIFRPAKVHHRCPTCGLARHDPDAVHCKACGTLLNIPTKGDDP